jgi:hypothetical protein
LSSRASELYSRSNNDLSYRFFDGGRPWHVGKTGSHRSIASATDGMTRASSCGLIELNGDDLRRDPLNVRKATLASVLARAAPGLRLNEHLEADGPDVFHHACMLGLEGIVSKRKDSQYRSGRSPHWIKSKNPNAPAVKREAEEDWGR